MTFGIYIHWPFCAQKCPYCDFNSHVRHQPIDEARFLEAYIRELRTTAEMLGASPSLRSLDSPSPSRTSPSPLAEEGWGRGCSPSSDLLHHPRSNPPPSRGRETVATSGTRTVTSIFFGGGTPSLMQPATVAAILYEIANLWPVDSNAEITLEANPGSVDAGRFQGYRAAGVNRVSLGVQSLNDEELKKLGRIHSVAEAKAALDIARRTFNRFSFDLIYARPGHEPDAWRAELAEALAMAGDHLSLYQLTIEPDTPYAALAAAGKLIVPDADRALDLYAVTQELTDAAGFPAYEISNHARPGEESRHNLLYWRYGEYAGIGPGAHGRLLINDVRHATTTERNPERWCELVEKNGTGITDLTHLTRAEESDEMLLMGLRLREGLDLDQLAALGGVRPSPSAIDGLERLGLIERCTGIIPASRVSGDKEHIAACLGPSSDNGEWADLQQAPENSFMSHVHTDINTTKTSPGIIRATPRGRFVLNAVVAELSNGFEPVPAHESRIDIARDAG